MMQRTLEPDSAPDNEGRRVGQIGNRWIVDEKSASPLQRGTLSARAAVRSERAGVDGQAGRE